MKLSLDQRNARWNHQRARGRIALLPAPTDQQRAAFRGTIYRSEWTIPQLTSFIYPANRDRIIWQPPGGGEIIFAREEFDRPVMTFTPEGWHCREEAPGAYTLRHRDGWVWRYRDGLPTLLIAPSGRVLDFIHEKGLLTRLRQRLTETDQASAQEVLRVRYDDQRRPVSLTSGPAEHRFVYDKVTGHLLAWASNQAAPGPATARVDVDPQNPEMSPAIRLLPEEQKGLEDAKAVFGVTRFLYIDDLLASYQFPGGRVQRLTWNRDQGRLLHDGLAAYTMEGNASTGVTFTRTDAARRTTTVRIDPVRGELTTTHPDGTRETVGYQRRAAGRGLLREKRGAEGQILAQIDYNARHVVAAVRQLGLSEVRNIYDAQDRLIEVWRAGEEGGTPGAAPAGKLWQRYTYRGSLRSPATVTDALGQISRFDYDERGQITRAVSPGGAETRFRYDPWGRLTRRDVPGGYYEAFDYDAHGRLTEHRQVDGNVNALLYDERGRIATRTDYGDVYTHRYDDSGRLIAVQRNSQPWMSWHLTQEVVTLVQPKKAPAGWRQGTPAALSVAGTTVLHKDPRGFVTKRCYDEQGRLVEAVNPLGERTSYRYNAVGEVLGWIDARGHALLFTRDVAGRIVRQENALGQTVTWEFDGAGRLTTRSNGVQTARYRFDGGGRLTRIDYGQGQVVSYERDSFGRVLTASTAELSTTYRYDELDRPIRVEQRPLSGDASGLAYAYAPDGQKREVSVLRPDAAGRLTVASTTRYEHDPAGRVKSISVDGSTAARHVYQPDAPRLQSKHLGNGIVYRYRYDEQGRTRSLDVVGTDGNVRQQLLYDWDQYGLLAGRVLSRPATAGGENTTVSLTYGYDSLGRLATVRSAEDPRQDRLYRYDEVGNMVENRSTERWATMTFDAANQLVSKEERINLPESADGGSRAPVTEVTAFAYDRAGRMTQETTDGRIERQFSYGYLDKVLAVDLPAGRRADYVYDANGMLARKAVRPDGDSPKAPWETWLWDGLALVRRGDELIVNEDHVAGGMALMSRPLTTIEAGSAAR